MPDHARVTSFVQFQIDHGLQPGQIEDLLHAAGLEFPLAGVAPCGTPFHYEHAWDFPPQDTRCPCGGECWIVRWGPCA